MQNFLPMAMAAEDVDSFAKDAVLSPDQARYLRLHHLDNPDTIFVSQVLFGSNYASWSRNFCTAFSAKNKLGFIVGTLEALNHTYVSYPTWFRCTTMVKSWLLNALASDIAASVVYIADCHTL
ncbi:Uncharacterized protein Adt_23591 [Abeliophyllum distichum]|uniref:Retrotransposon Copia-like N-terminal domain-containing protein n=1 Tax=Abeliophyllum distichum TaxID=126358 RepID=A0ABD1SBK0_9LAMI